MAGVAPVGDLSHALESLLAGAENLPIANSIRMMGLVQRTLDTLSGQIGAIARGKPVVSPDTLLGEIAAASPGAGASGTQGTPERQPKAPSMRETAEPPAAAREDAATTLRVDANWLDGVIRRSGEVGKQHVRLLQQNARLGRRVSQLQAILKRVTQRLDSLGERGETALPEAGDEARENARVLSDATVLLRESSGVTAAIAELQRDSASLLTQQARIARCLQEDLLNARVLPFGHVQARLTRLVRLTADAVGKRVRLTLSGADTVLDRSVLERFVAPLEHLLRNAVVHGIEPPSTRAALGKPQVGEVSIALTREDNDAVFDIADNGAGIDTVKVRERAVALGLVAADAQLPESEVLALTLRPGLSTADAVTQEAGRGVGLDVVSTQVASLNGELTLYSSPGRGMRARVRLPLTLSVA
jgi:chemosensory pili system protein ChpA (sensor histidine kinase/response regulator)